jgi:hypothetical protein
MLLFETKKNGRLYHLLGKGQIRPLSCKIDISGSLPDSFSLIVKSG